MPLVLSNVHWSVMSMCVSLQIHILDHKTDSSLSSNRYQTNWTQWSFFSQAILLFSTQICGHGSILAPFRLRQVIRYTNMNKLRIHLFFSLLVSLACVYFVGGTNGVRWVHQKSVPNAKSGQKVSSTNCLSVLGHSKLDDSKSLGKVGGRLIVGAIRDPVL